MHYVSWAIDMYHFCGFHALVYCAYVNIVYTDLFRWCNLIKCWVFLSLEIYTLVPQLFYCTFDNSLPRDKTRLKNVGVSLTNVYAG